MKVGFIGLGNMGSGMVSTLLKSRHEVTVWNRTRKRAEPLVEQGAVLAKDIAETCQGEAVVTMLADDQAVEGVVFGENGILKSLQKSAIHISSSTISIALSEKLAAEHAKAGQRFVAAPVFGRPEAAAAAKLFIVAAGPENAVAECQPLFDAMGQKTFRFGTKASAASMVKISGNFLIASVIESLGEAIALAGKHGIDAHEYVDFLTSTLFSSPIYRTYGGLIADRKFEPAGFVAPLGLKDVRLALAAGDQYRLPMPVASVLRDRLLSLISRAGDAVDWVQISQLDTGRLEGRKI